MLGCWGVRLLVWRRLWLFIFSLLVNSRRSISGPIVGVLHWPGDAWDLLRVIVGWWVGGLVLGVGVVFFNIVYGCVFPSVYLK